MTAVIATVVRAAHRRRAVVITLVMATLLLSIEGIRRLTFDTDVLSLLPREGRAIQGFRTFVDAFGNLDQLYVVFTAPEGHTVSEYSVVVERWVDELRTAPEILRVDAGVVDETRDFSWLADRQLLLLPDAALTQAIGRLQPDGMGEAVAARRELLTVPSADVAGLIRQDPIGLFDLLRDSLGSTQAGLNMGVGPDGYVSPDGQARLVLARPIRPPYDADFSRALTDRLEAIRGKLANEPPPTDIDDVPLPALSVAFAGGHRIAVETEAVVRRESIFNTVGSLALILPLLFLVFRSVWLMAVGSLPSAFSLVIVLGGLGFAGARLSAAATGAAAMLFGLGVDGVVLLYVAHHLRGRETEAGRPRGAGHETEAIEGPSVSMLLGMWTTAATFYGLIFVDFPSLEQLGRLIGHSMLVCGILTLVMVPALLPRRAPAAATRALLMPGLAAWVGRRRSAILAGAAVLTVVLGLAAVTLKVNPTLDRLRSTTDAARLEEEIGPTFGLPRDVYVILAEGADLQPLLEVNERLARQLRSTLPTLSFEPATRLLPSDSVQQRRGAQWVAAGVSPASVATALETARVDAGFAPNAFAPFVDRLPALLDSTSRIRYEDFEQHGLTDLIGRFIVRDGDRWRLATYAFPASASEVAAIEAVVADVDSAQVLTGLPIVNAALAERFVPDFMTGLAIGSTLVAVLVFFTFRDVRLSLLALLPTAIGLIWTAGILALAGVELDLFAVFAVVTFVGIGVDYGVHLVHRYQERGDAARATSELAPVILVAGAITLFGYATLINSSYPPLRSIGLVSTVSVVALAGASVVVLPALLLPRQNAS